MRTFRVSQLFGLAAAKGRARKAQALGRRELEQRLSALGASRSEAERIAGRATPDDLVRRLPLTTLLRIRWRCRHG
jgi:hypothetical protein